MTLSSASHDVFLPASGRRVEMRSISRGKRRRVDESSGRGADSTVCNERINRTLPLTPIRGPNQAHAPTLAAAMGTEESTTKKRPTSTLLMRATPPPNETYGLTSRVQRAGAVTSRPPDAVNNRLDPTRL